MTPLNPIITPGQTLQNPVTGERFTFLGLRPGGAVPIAHAASGGER